MPVVDASCIVEYTFCTLILTTPLSLTTCSLLLLVNPIRKQKKDHSVICLKYVKQDSVNLHIYAPSDEAAYQALHGAIFLS